MMRNLRNVLSVMILATLAAPANAAISGTLLGTDAPSEMLGGLTMTRFALDSQPVFAEVSSAALDGSNPPAGTLVQFSVPLSHRRIGSGWGSWSHGDTGDVYVNFGFAPVLTLSLPGSTRAFYLYVEPGPFQTYEHSVTATTDAGDSITLTAMIDGLSGATGFGFVASPGESIQSIEVANLDNPGITVAVGEFGIAIPTPGAVVLLIAGITRKSRGRTW